MVKRVIYIQLSPPILRDEYEIIDEKKFVKHIQKEDYFWHYSIIRIREEILTSDTKTFREIKSHNLKAIRLREEIKTILFDIYPYGLRELILEYI